MGCGSSSRYAANVEKEEEARISKAAAAIVAATQSVQPPPATPESLNFRRIMRDENARGALLAYCEREHSEENLLFFEAAQKFRQMYSMIDTTDEAQVERMYADAKAVVDKFLRDDSELVVNLPASNPFKKGISNDTTTTANMFDPMARIIHKTIEDDVFPRFKRSSYAVELLKSLPRMAMRRSTITESSGG